MYLKRSTFSGGGRCKRLRQIDLVRGVRLSARLPGNVAALDKRGRFAEVLSRGTVGQGYDFELQYRMEITGKERLVTYSLKSASARGSGRTQGIAALQTRPLRQPLSLSQFLQRRRLRHYQ
jgi:predicted ATPase